jgi:long-chain acyl-CoA synthetase
MIKQHISHMIAERAEQYQSREVFRYFDKSTQKILSMSWNEMIGQTRAVSSLIKSLGYGYDDKIGIFSGNRPEWSIADLGILAVRGVVVPFYATASKHEIKYIVDETEMRLMFVGNHEQLEKALWVLDHCETLDRLVVFEEEALAEVEEDDLATIIYTSGTTGEPKGVMLGHNHFMFAFGIHDKRLSMDDKDVSLCFLPLSHVFERTWTFYVLHKGAVNHYLENPREVIEMMLTPITYSQNHRADHHHTTTMAQSTYHSTAVDNNVFADTPLPNRTNLSG